MTEDQRAHNRIDNLEETVRSHLTDHAKFEAAIAENTQLTRAISENTAELVTLVRGAKGLRSFLVWVTPVVLAASAVWAWLKVAAK